MRLKNVTSKYLIFLAFAMALAVSCSDPPDYPDVPEIEYLGLSRDTLIQGDLNIDSTILHLSFTDGDGDLGFDPDESEQSIFITDTRTGFVQDRFKIPKIPIQGSRNEIFGEIEVRIYTTCCIFPDQIPPCSAPNQYPVDSVVYEVYIVDRAGNESNRILTEPIILLCQ